MSWGDARGVPEVPKGVTLPGVWSYSSPLVSPRDGGQWDRSDFERIRDEAMTMGNRL